MLAILPFIILGTYLFNRFFPSRKKAGSFNHQRSTKNEEYTRGYEQKHQDHTKEKPKPAPSPTSNLYSLLGVRHNASKEELKIAFKNKMMLNHPDKLAALDPELQKFATERTIAIKAAYERLTASVH